MATGRGIVNLAVRRPHQRKPRVLTVVNRGLGVHIDYTRPPMSPNEGVMETLVASYVVMILAEGLWELMRLCAKHAGCGCVLDAEEDMIADAGHMVSGNVDVPPMTMMSALENEADEVGTEGPHLRTLLEHMIDLRQEDRRRVVNELQDGRGDPRRLEGSPHRRRVV